VSFTNHVLCKRSVVLVTALKPTKHIVSLAPTQSGIEYVLTTRTTILQGILDDARLTYLLKKLNPLHATRTLKQREINSRLDNIKKNLEFVITYSASNPILHVKFL
jgi:hypothetical protein